MAKDGMPHARATGITIGHMTSPYPYAMTMTKKLYGLCKML